jgi:hypothetical protein
MPLDRFLNGNSRFVCYRDLLIRILKPPAIASFEKVVRTSVPGSRMKLDNIPGLIYISFSKQPSKRQFQLSDFSIPDITNPVIRQMNCKVSHNHLL